MRVTCPSCKREIPPEDINIQSAIAKCSACGEFFMLGNNVPGVATAGLKAMIPQPKGITVYHEMDTLIIYRRWYHWYSLVQTMVYILLYPYFIRPFIEKGHGNNNTMYWNVIFIAIGSFLIYQNLAGYLNRTEIRITEGNIRIQHGPLPWSGNKLLQTEGINQIISAENTEGQFNMGFFYDIIIRYNNGKSERLLTDIAQWDQARFIEQQLGAYYGVKEERLTGEIGIL